MALMPRVLTMSPDKVARRITWPDIAIHRNSNPGPRSPHPRLVSIAHKPYQHGHAKQQAIFSLFLILTIRSTDCFPFPVPFHGFMSWLWAEPEATCDHQGYKGSHKENPKVLSVLVQMLNIHTKYRGRKVERHVYKSKYCVWNIVNMVNRPDTPPCTDKFSLQHVSVSL